MNIISVWSSDAMCNIHWVNIGLMARSHYLNKYWLFIKGNSVAPESFKAAGQANIILLHDEFENYTFKFSATSTNGQT